MNWIEQIRSCPREWRRFGLLIGLLLIGLGLWLGWQTHPAARAWCLVAGLVALLLSWIAPSLLRWPYLIWMTIGLFLGTIVSTLLLTLLFFFLVTPIALIARLLGKDFLALKLVRNGSSYWKRREPAQQPEPARYERQF
jgi:hypothetical protein